MKQKNCNNELLKFKLKLKIYSLQSNKLRRIFYNYCQNLKINLTYFKRNQILVTSRIKHKYKKFKHKSRICHSNRS